MTVQAQLHLGTGVLTITSDEYIDLTPLSDVDIGKVALVDNITDSAGVLAAFDTKMVFRLCAGVAYESFATVLLNRDTTVVVAPDSICSGHGIRGLSEQDCTGITGNSWTPPKCVGGSAAADPYSVDTGITGNDVYDGKQCTDGGGTYTPPSCTNNGNPESEAACEGIQLGTCATSGSNSHCAAATTAAECSAATISGGGNIGANACIFTNNIFTAGPDGYVLTAKLSEVQRVRAILLPSLEVYTLRVLRNFEVGTRRVHGCGSKRGAPLSRRALCCKCRRLLMIKPNILSAEIHTGEFWIKVRFSETIDTTPSTLVDLSKLFLSKDADGKISLDVAGITVNEIDRLTVTINLVEHVRIAGMYFSGGSGGDGENTTTILTVESGAFSDIGTNRNGPSTVNLNMLEHEDTDPPQLISATLNYSTGVLVVSSQETLAIFTKSELQRLDRYHLRDVSGDTSADNTVTLGGPDLQFDLDPELSGLSTTIVNQGADSTTHTTAHRIPESASLGIFKHPKRNGNPDNTFTPSSCFPSTEFNSDFTSCIESGSTFTVPTCRTRLDIR